MTNKDKYQEIFTKAYTGLSAQGFERSSRAETGICWYRSRNGRKCAIGHCIPDDKYTPKLEGKNAAAISILEIVWPDADKDAQAFLTKLQHAHDYANSPENMKNLLHNVARFYELQVPEIPK